MIRVTAVPCLLALLLSACAAEDVGPPCPETTCGETLMCQVPADPAEPGPWPVGARTAVIGGITTEVWYPAVIGSDVGQDPAGDTRALLAAVAAGQGELAFLVGRVDLDRVGLAGHSAGGKAVAALGDVAGLRARVPMASGGVDEPVAGEQVLVMGAVDDQVVKYEEQVAGYEAAASPKRLVGIANAGNLAFSDLCAITNADGDDIVEIAIEYEINNASLATSLWDGCEPDQTAPADGWAIVEHTTTAVLEQALSCGDAGPAFQGLQAAFPLISEYREAL